jgi:glycosyltransferase involved in cell wall biosynthesis
VRPALGDASVFVLPSYYPEGLPRTIVEAMATGRPIITTDAPGCRETVILGCNGCLVPVRKVPALSEAVLRFVEPPELIASMDARAGASLR